MVKNLFKKSLNALSSKQTNIFSAAFFIMATTVFSQVLGFLKYRLLVQVFQASGFGVFMASFRIPDFVFQIIIAGALSSAFIPIFSEYITRDKKNEAFAFTSSLITLGITVFFVISIIIFIFSYQLSHLIAPGFSSDQLTLMSNMTRVLLLSQLFFVLGTLITAILQSFQHFLIPGIAASFYNIGIILGIIFLAPIFGLYGALIGVLIGAILYCLVQIPLLKTTGFKFIPKFDLKNIGVLKTIDLMVPRSITLLISQIAITASLFFASFKSPRDYGIFELAQTLFMAPVVLFGQSIAQASFPALSIKNENKKEFTYIFLSSLTQILYLTMPVSAILIVLRIPVVRLFYGASGFSWTDTTDTGKTLAAFAISIFAQALIYLLSRAFFALKDTKTPLIVTIFSVIINIILSYYFILVLKFPIYYLALSNSIPTILSILIFIIFLHKRVDGVINFQIIFEIFKIFLATAIMGIALYIPVKLLDQLVFDTTRTINLLILTGIASIVGFASYVFFTWLLNIKESFYVVAVFRKFGDWNKILKQIKELIEPPKINP